MHKNKSARNPAIIETLEAAERNFLDIDEKVLEIKSKALDILALNPPVGNPQGGPPYRRNGYLSSGAGR